MRNRSQSAAPTPDAGFPTKEAGCSRGHRNARPWSLATKTILNHLTFALGVFAFAVKRGRIPSNPVVQADRPVMPEQNPDIRYLVPTSRAGVLAPS